MRFLEPPFTDRYSALEHFLRGRCVVQVRHPNVVRLLDIVAQHGKFAVVTEWVPGGLLSDRMGTCTGPLSWEHAQPLVVQLLDAVASAHEQGVLQLDVTPDNVRVTLDGVMKVLDPGIASLGGPSWSARVRRPSLDFLAPEQIFSPGEASRRADVYTLGVILYVMLAGRLPWTDDTSPNDRLERKGDAVPPPTVYARSIPEGVVRAVLEALEPDPGRRTPSVLALRAALGLGPPASSS